MPPENPPSGVEGWGILRMTYTVELVEKLAKCFKDNDFSISRTYFVAKEFIFPHGESEFIIDLIEDLDHIRRFEPLRNPNRIPSDWIEELKEILCLTH
jgi:hypothetical protein